MGTHSQNKLEQFSCLDGHRQNHFMLFLQIHEFFSSQKIVFHARYVGKVKLENQDSKQPNRSHL